MAIASPRPIVTRTAKWCACRVRTHRTRCTVVWSRTPPTGAGGSRCARRADWLGGTGGVFRSGDEGRTIGNGCRFEDGLLTAVEAAAMQATPDGAAGLRQEHVAPRPAAAAGRLSLDGHRRLHRQQELAAEMAITVEPLVRLGGRGRCRGERCRLPAAHRRDLPTALPLPPWVVPGECTATVGAPACSCRMG